MKNVSKVILVFLLGMLLTGCKKSSVITTKCEKIFEDTKIKQTFTLESVNEDVKKMHVDYLFDNGMFAVDSLAVLDEETKESIRKGGLTMLKLNEESYQGLSINVSIEDKMNIEVAVDLKKVEPETLKNLNLNLDINNQKISTIKDYLTENGYTCK
ncbi:MAG: hypothetical protein E7164_03865 [Firmicutes bacterium]|nr:hypothetical protein [Bacillota bacterium]